MFSHEDYYSKLTSFELQLLRVPYLRSAISFQALRPVLSQERLADITGLSQGTISYCMTKLGGKLLELERMPVLAKDRIRQALYSCKPQKNLTRSLCLPIFVKTWTQYYKFFLCYAECGSQSTVARKYHTTQSSVRYFVAQFLRTIDPVEYSDVVEFFYWLSDSTWYRVGVATDGILSDSYDKAAEKLRVFLDGIKVTIP